MSWNYRVIRTAFKDEVHFAIHEVFYDKNIPTAWSSKPAPMGADSAQDLLKALVAALRGLTEPILEIVDYQLIEWKDAGNHAPKDSPENPQ